jgi:hypothetical protein
MIRRLAIINLGLVALQPISAGLLMSGYAPALTIHAVVATALQLGALVQVVTAGVQWWRGRLSARAASASLGLFVIVFLEVGLGYNRRYWLHVPIGVGLFGALIRQTSRLDAPARDPSAAAMAHGLPLP